MPVYTYACTACAKRQTAFRKIDDRDDCPRCERCLGDTERRITATMVSVFTPYRAVAIDKESGKYPVIRSADEHRAFLTRNGYEEVGNDSSMAPLPQEEVKHRKRQKVKEMEADPNCDFTFDPVTQAATPKATLGETA